MSLPKISLVTPSYNQGPYLEQTIRSVLDQNYPNLEYMVIDGGSTDESVAVIKKYADRLTYWVSEKDAGQTDAINKGIARCTGDVFGFINSDDYLYPRSLDKVASTWGQGVRWMVGWSLYLEQGDSDWPYMVRPVQRDVDWFVHNPIPQQSSFFARSFFEQVGTFRTDLHYSFDYEYWMRLRFKAGVRPFLIRQCMSAFRLHGASKTTTVWSRFEGEDAKVWDEYAGYLSARDRLKLAGIRRRMGAEVAHDKMWRAIKAKDPAAARRQAWAALKHRPLSAGSYTGLAHALRGG